MWCTSQNMCLSAAHIHGAQNTEAESLFRNFNETIEWTIDYFCFRKFQLCLETQH